MGEGLEKFIDKYPESNLVPQARLKLANSFFQQGNYSKARENYTWVTKISEEGELSVEAQYRIGDCWFNEAAGEKDYEKAVEKYNKAVVEYLRVVHLYPQFEEWKVKAQLQTGKSYEVMGKKNEAKNTYQKILEDKSLKEKWIKEVEKRLEELK